MAKLMGILNVTPDSFYAPSRAMDMERALERAKQIYSEGADILDIGGESTRPNATPVPEAEELQRVIPIIKALKGLLPLSIDTFKPRVAAEALKAGAEIINDVSGFTDPSMRALAAESGVTICVMHMQGNPINMQQNPHYPNGIIPELLSWFKIQIELLLKAGVKEKQIILDPGIGFGKTVAHNLEIIENLAVLKAMGFPLLVGVSRKSFMAKILGKNSAELLPATLAMNTALLLAGVDIIRVHDIGEHRDVMNLMDRLNNKNG